jgi:hypothetical protein
LPEVCPQGFSISRYPGLHAGGHQQHLIIGGTVGLYPIISMPEVLPGSLLQRFCGHGQWIFTVDQQADEMVGFWAGVSGFEVVEGGASATAGCEPRHAPTEALAFEQAGKGFTATDLLLL